MSSDHRSVKQLRARFEKIYESDIVKGGFVESSDYYENEKERYWRSLELLCQAMVQAPARVLEIGGGQLALLLKKLFDDDCVVADVSERYVAPVKKANIPFFVFDLVQNSSPLVAGHFDVVILLEVIEHIPLPGYIVVERIQKLLKTGGVLFLTTRNLFRIRNLVRMVCGIEFLDHFMLPKPGENLGHQLEYSAQHLEWQLKRAGMQIIMLRHDSLGRTGHSIKARLARKLVAPLELRPIWRDGLVAVARKTQDSH